MDTDRNLLFGVLALQADFLNAAQFAEACAAWSTRKNVPLADLLVERGWLTAEDRADVEKLLQRKLTKHAGDARASLAESTNDIVRQTLSGIDDPDIRNTLTGSTPPPVGHVLIATTDNPTERRDRYTLSHLHATGGIGRVWLAHDGKLGREVALKELRPERSGVPALWGRFLKEAQITGQLAHPGIVPVYEVGQRPDDQSPFYTMRFVRGRTLSEAIASFHGRRARSETGPLDLRELMTAFVGVCNAIAYAHSRGVLHRDLKPRNVVLGDFGEVIVLDWGLAKLATEKDADAQPLELEAGASNEATEQGQVLGTPAYMAPEQADGRIDLLDARTDVYGLGAILYEILTGQPPFSGKDKTAVLQRVRHESPARPRSIVPTTPKALEAVALKALSKRPNQRYDTAKEVASEATHWLADEPVTAYREPWTIRTARFARHWKTTVVAGGVLLATTTIAALIAMTLIFSEQRKTKIAWLQAEQNAQTAVKVVNDVSEYIHAVETGGFQKTRTDVERKTALTATLASYEQLRAIFPADTHLLEHLARMKRYLGKIHQLLNETDPAQRAFGEARDLYAKLVEAQPGNSIHRANYALTGRDQAVLLHALGRLQRGSDEMDAALRVSRELFLNEPNKQAFARSYATMLIDRADMDYQLGKLIDCERHSRLSFELLAKLLGAPDPSWVDRMYAGMAQTRIALVLRETGKAKEALPLHDTNVEALAALVHNVSNRDTLQQLQRAQLERAWTLASDPQKRAQGIADLDAAIATCRKLQTQFAGAAMHTRWLGFGLYYRGRLKRLLGSREESEANLRDAVVIQEKLLAEYPDWPAYRAELGRTLIALGETITPRAEAGAQLLRARKLVGEALTANPVNAQYKIWLTELDELERIR